MRTPLWKFVIQYQTWTATTTGIAQASTSAEVRRTRTTGPTLTSRSASSVPPTTVSDTHAAVNTTVRSNVCQKMESERTDV